MIKLVQEGEWEIDDSGRIWRTCIRRGGRHGVMLVPCKRRRVEKQQPNGHMLVRAMRDGVRVTGLAQRLVWQRFNGDIPDGKTVRHRNGIKNDNRPSNFELATCSELAVHTHRSGLLDQSGQTNPNAKLRNNEVAQIRLAYQQGGHTMDQLAGRFGVKVQTISKIVRGQRRKKQEGPVSGNDQRHDRGAVRNATNGRYMKKAAGRELDGRTWSEFPA